MAPSAPKTSNLVAAKMQILSRDGMGSDFTIQIPFSFLFNILILLSIF